jgi:hypothetical protein
MSRGCESAARPCDNCAYGCEPAQIYRMPVWFTCVCCQRAHVSQRTGRTARAMLARCALHAKCAEDQEAHPEPVPAGCIVAEDVRLRVARHVGVVHLRLRRGRSRPWMPYLLLSTLLQ